jgi:hypothetical protein
MLLLVTAAGVLVGVAGVGPCSIAQAAVVPFVSAPAGSGLASATPSASARPNPSGPSDTVAAAAGCGDGGVLARAASWLTAWAGGPVPYASGSDPSTWFGGYRRDCSGYASMVLGLPGPGLDTAALAAGSIPISKAQLRAGDLLINPGTGPAGHLVVFDRWTGPGMDSYLGFEQSGDGGTHHRVIPYPYFGGDPMSPYRHPAGPTDTAASSDAMLTP